MNRSAFAFAFSAILYVASPVAQAFATSHVRPPDTALVQPISADTELTPGADTENPRGTSGTFLIDNHEAFRTYGLIIGAALGLTFAFWRARIATRQAEAAAARADAAIEQARAANEQAQAANEQARAANKQAGTAEQGQITERFSRAVEQLGHDRVAVRIGGLYALKRIAEDSVERDHLAIMDVLTNFIRQTPYADAQREAAERENALSAFWTNSADENAEADPIDRADQTADAAPRPPEPELIDCPDIVAAIEIIQGRSEEQKALEDKRAYRLSLSRASLGYLRLPEVDLQYCDLTGAYLRGANLTDATLTCANLTNADLTAANLLRAKLTGARLWSANLTSTDLLGADLTGATLEGADLTGAGFVAADLTGANLTDTLLLDADLRSANLTNADLTGAHLSGADLRSADLRSANLRDTDLTGANLANAKNLTQEQLDSAGINEGGTPPILPEGLKPPRNVCPPWVP